MLNRLLIAALAAGSLMCAAAQDYSLQDEWLNQPMTRAVMDSYAEMLEQNPKDYLVYYRRANEYYNHNSYSRALSDVDEALKYAPAKEKDIRFQCYSLRASILERINHVAEAIADLDKAIEISPESYTAVYQRANLELEDGRIDAARADFQKLSRLNSRSQEALFGLARIAVMEKNSGQAIKYADDAVALYPASADSYLRRAAIYQLLGDNSRSVDDYIRALAMSGNSSIRVPLQRLVDMSYTDYNAVMTGLSAAIANSPRDGIYYYIRAEIAQSHFHYPAAVSDYNYILVNRLLETAGVYRSIAECYYALGAYEPALINVDKAIGSSADNAASYVVKSDIKRAMGEYRMAQDDAERALDRTPGSAAAYVAEALAQLRQGLTTEASANMGRAVVAANNDPYINLLRAWVLRDYTHQADAAREYYEKVVGLTTYPDADVRSLKGFALLNLGRTEEADAWIESVLADAATTSLDGEVEYIATCYYAARGDESRAFVCMAQSLDKGYSNYHNWTAADEAGITVAPLRSNPRFQALLTRYSHIFTL